MHGFQLFVFLFHTHSDKCAMQCACYSRAATRAVYPGEITSWTHLKSPLRQSAAPRLTRVNGREGAARR